MLGRERLSRWGAALAFCAAAAALSVTAPSDGRALTTWSPALVLLYAIASRIDFEIGSGSTVPSQLVFMPMLFMLPAGLVPAAVAVGLVAGRLPDFVRGGMHPERVAALVGSAWYSVAPAVVFVAAGEPHVGRQASPRRSRRSRHSSSTTSSSRSRASAALSVARPGSSRPFAMDLPGRRPAHAGRIRAGRSQRQHGRRLCVCVLPLLDPRREVARERGRRPGDTLELLAASRGTVFLLGDQVAPEDEYSGTHSRAGGDLVLAACRSARSRRELTRNAEFAATATTSGRSHPRLDPSSPDR